MAWRSTPAEHQPKLTFIATVSFRKVLDLSNAEVRSILDLGHEDLFGSWRLKTSSTRLQKIGEVISKQKEVSAIRYPSWAAKRLGNPGWNLAIFPSALKAPDLLEIRGDSDIPLEVLP